MIARSYRDYKESGVDWIGRIPSHWSIYRLKYAVTLITEKTNQRTFPVALENIEGWSGKFLPTESDYEGDGVAFEAGDILFGKLRPYLAKAFLSDRSGEAVGDFHVFRPTSMFFGRFGQYQILSRDFISVVDGSTYGAKMPRASWDFMGGLPIVLPSIDEQRTIASFLDRETAKIDALVKEQEKLIELLKEKRQAVISHAVTKGINTKAEMKDSGVGWLGDVPKHWHLTAVGHVCEFISYGFTNPMPVTDDGPFMLTANDVGYGKINYSSARHTSTVAFGALTGKSRPLKNDILLTKDGTLGRAALHDGTEACINQSVAVLRPALGIILPQFLELALLGSVYQEKILFDAGGTTIKHIYITRLSKMHLALPSLEEQRAIVSYLEDFLPRIDDLLLESINAIELLSEHRSALISAAVTGKIDVRDFVDTEAA